MPKGIGYPGSKKFNGKSVRVKDADFSFNEFRENQKAEAGKRNAKAILASLRPSPKVTARKKNLDNAKKAVKK